MLGSVTIHRLLGKMQEVNASDLHIKIGSPPVLRIDSHLHRVESGDLTAEDTSKLLAPIIPAHLKPPLQEKGGVDFSHMDGPTQRFSIASLQPGAGLPARVRRGRRHRAYRGAGDRAKPARRLGARPAERECPSV